MVNISKRIAIIFLLGLSTVAVIFYDPILSLVDTLRPTKTLDEDQSPKLLIGKKKIRLEVADTLVKRARGLSGRKKMAPDSGMLFIFDNAGYPSFWMREMYINIDIVWLNENWQVVDITPNLTPATFPHSFYPKAPAKYVIEIPAGMAGKWGIKEGEKLSLSY